MKEKLLNFQIYLGGLILFIQYVFFALLSIFGIEYSGADESSLYVNTIIILTVTFYFSTAFRLLLFKSTSYEWYLILVSAILITILFGAYLLALIPLDYFVKIALLVYPSFLFGIILGINFCSEYVSKLFFGFALIITLSFLFLVPKMFVLSTYDLISFFGGGQYQAFSYAMGLAFLISYVYYSFYRSRKNRKNVFFFYSLFLVQFFGILLSGGRGGAVLAFLGLILILFYKISLIRLIGKFVFVTSLLYFILTLLPKLPEEYSGRISESSSRVFSYLTSAGIDFEATSNRDIKYKDALTLIQKSPFFGYGFFGYWKITKYEYPHNFILELMLQGGVILLFIFIIVFIMYLVKLYNLIKLRNGHEYIFATFLYSLVYLSFSGTYLLEPFFWFNLAYILCARSRKVCFNGPSIRL